MRQGSRSLPIDARHGARLFHRRAGLGVRNLEFERQVLLDGHPSEEDAHRIRKEAGLPGNLLILEKLYVR